MRDCKGCENEELYYEGYCKECFVYLISDQDIFKGIE